MIIFQEDNFHHATSHDGDFEEIGSKPAGWQYS